MGILERITQNTDNIYWESGEEYFPVKNRYTAGVAGQRFLEEIKENARIYGSKCSNCQLIHVPPKMYCERCFAELKEWVDVGIKGSVYTYTVAHVEKDGSEKTNPTLVAAVKIADGFIMHRLENCKPEDVEIGMEVQANFKPKGERTGSIMDISGFELV